MEIEMSKERVEWKWGGGKRNETKRQNAVTTESPLWQHISHEQCAQVDKWKSGKLRAATGLYYIWQNLNWIGLDWNCT